MAAGGCSSVPKKPVPGARNGGNQADPALTMLTFLLAGKKIPAGFQAGNLVAPKDYPSYARAQKKAGGREKQRLVAIRAWAGSHLVAVDPKVVLLPFAGPDFLTARAFFPDAGTIILLGVEKPGVLPRVEELQAGGRLAGLLDYAARWTDMGFRKWPPRGLNPEKIRELSGWDSPLIPFLVQAGQGGLIPEFYGPIKINPGGKLVPDPHPEGETGWNRGFHLFFRDPGSGRETRVVYLRVNPGTTVFKRNQALRRFLKNQPGLATLWRGGLYLSHHGEFEAFTRLVLRQSNLVLQDGSGPPRKLLDQGQGFQLSLFGEYQTPGLFSRHHQPDLARAFAARSPKTELPFTFGHGETPKTSGLIMARKKLPANTSTPPPGHPRKKN